MEYEISKHVRFPNSDFYFIPSDRKTLADTLDKAFLGQDREKWKQVGFAALTPFLHADKNNFVRSYNIDADDIVILLAPDLVAKAFEKVEEYADKEELDCIGLDMFLSRSFGTHWSFGVVYVSPSTSLFFPTEYSCGLCWIVRTFFSHLPFGSFSLMQQIRHRDGNIRQDRSRLAPTIAFHDVLVFSILFILHPMQTIFDFPMP